MRPRTRWPQHDGTLREKGYEVQSRRLKATK